MIFVLPPETGDASVNAMRGEVGLVSRFGELSGDREAQVTFTQLGMPASHAPQPHEAKDSLSRLWQQPGGGEFADRQQRRNSSSRWIGQHGSGPAGQTNVDVHRLPSLRRLRPSASMPEASGAMKDEEMM